jgi:ubiquinone/menaquinone biosynthesis C-methylase UbiE
MATIGGSQFIEPASVLELIQLSEGQKVGYLGCGAGGYFTIPIAQRVGATGLLYAVDVMQEALEATQKEARRQNLTNIKYVLANLESYGKTPISTNSLDVALLINVLFQNKKHEDILKETDRLLRKNGKLVIIDWLTTTPQHFGPPTSSRVDLSKLELILTKLGYQKLWNGKAGDYHFAVVYKKV